MHNSASRFVSLCSDDANSKRLPCILAAILSRLRHSTVTASYLDPTVHANYFVARLLQAQHCSLSVIDVFFFFYFWDVNFQTKPDKVEGLVAEGKCVLGTGNGRGWECRH